MGTSARNHVDSTRFETRTGLFGYNARWQDFTYAKDNDILSQILKISKKTHKINFRKQTCRSISSCQSAAVTSEIAKRFWAAALYQAPDLYLLALSFTIRQIVNGHKLKVTSSHSACCVQCMHMVQLYNFHGIVWLNSEHLYSDPQSLRLPQHRRELLSQQCQCCNRCVFSLLFKVISVRADERSEVGATGWPVPRRLCTSRKQIKKIWFWVTQCYPRYFMQ